MLKIHSFLTLSGYCFGYLLRKLIYRNKEYFAVFEQSEKSHRITSRKSGQPTRLRLRTWVSLSISLQSVYPSNTRWIKLDRMADEGEIPQWENCFPTLTEQVYWRQKRSELVNRTSQKIQEFANWTGENVTGDNWKLIIVS